jgi:hypothetical protein
MGISKEKRKEVSGKTKGVVDKATTIESSGRRGKIQEGKRTRRKTIKSRASSEENQ